MALFETPKLSMLVVTTPENCRQCIFGCNNYCTLLRGRYNEFESGDRRNYDYTYNTKTKKYQECPLTPISVNNTGSIPIIDTDKRSDYHGT